MPRTWPSTIIYIVKGTDVRHNSVEDVETMVR